MDAIDYRKGRYRKLWECWLSGRRVNAVSEDAEILLLRLIMMADDFGNYAADVDRLLSTCFPMGLRRRQWDEDRVQSAMSELVQARLVAAYHVDDAPFVHVEDWDHFQSAPRNGKRVQRVPRPPPPIQPPPDGPGEVRGSPGESGGVQVHPGETGGNPGSPGAQAGRQKQLQEQLHPAPQVQVRSESAREVAGAMPAPPEKAPTPALPSTRAEGELGVASQSLRVSACLRKTAEVKTRGRFLDVLGVRDPLRGRVLGLEGLTADEMREELAAIDGDVGKPEIVMCQRLISKRGDEMKSNGSIAPELKASVDRLEQMRRNAGVGGGG